MTETLDPADEERLKRIEEILKNPDKPELAESFFDELNDMVMNSPALSQLFNSDVRYFNLDGKSDITPDPVDLSMIVANQSEGKFDIQPRADYAESSLESESEPEPDLNVEMMDSPPFTEDPVIVFESRPESEPIPEPVIDTVSTTGEKEPSKLTLIKDSAPPQESGTIVEEAPNDSKKDVKKKKKVMSSSSKKDETKSVKEIPKSVKSSDDLEKKFLERQAKIHDILNDGKGSISSNSV
jgi:hypothetical protein